MKKYLLCLLFVSGLLPSLSSAQGSYCNGRVSVSTYAGGNIALGAYMNVRWSTRSTAYNEYVSVNDGLWSGLPFTISAQDGDGDRFYCRISTSNVYYNKVRLLIDTGGLSDGSYLFAKRRADSSECIEINHSRRSCAQH